MGINNNTVIKIENVSKTFYIYESPISSIMDKAFNFFSRNKKRKIEALKNISFEVKKGEIFGVIGKNGSGKSTLLKIISGAFPPDKGGIVDVKEKMIRLSLGMGFDGNLSARENIYLNGSILGLSFRKIGSIFNQIIEFAELQNFVETPVKFYSSGMTSRLAFAIAIHAEADIFLIDEFFGGVGDENFRKKSEKVFRDAILEGRTIINVSHDLNSIRQFCNRVMLLNHGEVVCIGKPEEVLEKYNTLFAAT